MNSRRRAKSSGYTCPGCAANSDDFPECWHTPNEWALAEAMRDAVERMHPGADGWENGSVEGAWNFIGDAEGLPGDCGDAPYAIVMTHPAGGNYVAVGVINGRHLFGIPDGEGDSYGEYLGDLGGLLVEGPLASEWADYFEHHDGYVGAPALTVASMIKMLRGPVPFGSAQGVS